MLTNVVLSPKPHTSHLHKVLSHSLARDGAVSLKHSEVRSLEANPLAISLFCPSNPHFPEPKVLGQMRPQKSRLRLSELRAESWRRGVSAGRAAPTPAQPPPQPLRFYGFLFPFFHQFFGAEMEVALKPAGSLTHSSAGCSHDFFRLSLGSRPLQSVNGY